MVEEKLQIGNHQIKITVGRALSHRNRARKTDRARMRPRRSPREIVMEDCMRGVNFAQIMVLIIYIMLTYGCD